MDKNRIQGSWSDEVARDNKLHDIALQRANSMSLQSPIGSVSVAPREIWQPRSELDAGPARQSVPFRTVTAAIHCATVSEVPNSD